MHARMRHPDRPPAAVDEPLPRGRRHPRASVRGRAARRACCACWGPERRAAGCDRGLGRGRRRACRCACWSWRGCVSPEARNEDLILKLSSVCLSLDVLTTPLALPQPLSHVELVKLLSQGQQGGGPHRQGTIRELKHRHYRRGCSLCSRCSTCVCIDCTANTPHPPEPPPPPAACPSVSSTQTPLAAPPYGGSGKHAHV